MAVPTPTESIFIMSEIGLNADRAMWITVVVWAHLYVAGIYDAKVSIIITNNILLCLNLCLLLLNVRTRVACLHSVWFCKYSSNFSMLIFL